MQLVLFSLDSHPEMFTCLIPPTRRPPADEPISHETLRNESISLIVDIRLGSQQQQQQRQQLFPAQPLPSKQLSTAKPLFSGSPRTVTNGTARAGILRGTLKLGHLENIPVFIHSLATEKKNKKRGENSPASNRKC